MWIHEFCTYTMCQQVQRQKNFYKNSRSAINSSLSLIRNQTSSFNSFSRRKEWCDPRGHLPLRHMPKTSKTLILRYQILWMDVWSSLVTVLQKESDVRDEVHHFHDLTYYNSYSIIMLWAYNHHQDALRHMVTNFYFKLFILSIISTLRVERCSFIIHLVIISNYGFLTTVFIYDHLIFLTHCKQKLVSLFRCLYSFSFPIIQMNIPSFHSFYRTSCLDFSYKFSSLNG